MGQHVPEHPADSERAIDQPINKSPRVDELNSRPEIAKPPSSGVALHGNQASVDSVQLRRTSPRSSVERRGLPNDFPRRGIE